MPNFLKFIKFLWVCWFLGKNLANFVPPVWKLHNQYCHNSMPQFNRNCHKFLILIIVYTYVLIITWYLKLCSRDDKILDDQLNGFILQWVKDLLLRSLSGVLPIRHMLGTNVLSWGKEEVFGLRNLIIWHSV